MHFSMSNHLILLSLSAVLSILPCILFDESRTFSKIYSPERCFMKMTFHRRECTVVGSILGELIPPLKNRRKHVILYFINENNIIYDSLANKY